MRHQVHMEITIECSGEEGKSRLIKSWIINHPWPSWGHVVRLLRGLEREGRGRAGAAKEAEEKFVRSEFCGMHTLWVT